jgi:hypothetical protein
MQITINQSEIESAITTYIGGLFKLNPGTKVQIELKATRGAEGATAIIDIVPDFQTGPMMISAASAAVQESKKKEVAETIHEIKATSAKLFAASVAAEAPATVTVDEAIAAIPEVAQEAPVHDPVAEVPVPARTSLFAGLKKPVNT